MQNYFVYILYSQSTGKLYIGQTQDLTNRIEIHNRGYNKSTKAGKPWILFAFLKVKSRSMALSIERKIKNLKSKTRIINYLEKNNNWTFQDITIF